MKLCCETHWQCVYLIHMGAYMNVLIIIYCACTDVYKKCLISCLTFDTVQKPVHICCLTHSVHHMLFLCKEKKIFDIDYNILYIYIFFLNRKYTIKKNFKNRACIVCVCVCVKFNPIYSLSRVSCIAVFKIMIHKNEFLLLPHSSL